MLPRQETEGAAMYPTTTLVTALTAGRLRNADASGAAARLRLKPSRRAPMAPDAITPLAVPATGDGAANAVSHHVAD
jgi:hypothetical protein